MNSSYMLRSDTAKKLYSLVKDMPIIDYHCHLSPKEIYEDKVFEDVAQVMLGGDHYKWRIMRAAGIDEELVTGSASWHDKFMAFAEALELAAFNPVVQWTRMELDKYFGITEDLSPESAERIWKECNRVIKEKQLSPRKIMKMSNVVFVATTDDPADDLHWHKLIAEDKCFDVKVSMSYRPDRAMNLYLDYKGYIARLAESADMAIKNLSDLKAALVKRLDYFKSNGCCITDVGLEVFPDHIGSDEEAEEAFHLAMEGKTVSRELYNGFLGNMYLFLACEYGKRDMIMQLHMASSRNANTALFDSLGADVGGDCIGDVVPAKSIINILDGADKQGLLPKTILYTLTPALTATLSSIAGCFRRVIVGAAWWFCDHERGIRETCATIAETGYIGSFLGMLTDSRSFLSYPRHDYFRRIFCSLVAEWVDNDVYPMAHAEKLVKAAAFGNVEKMMME